MDVLELIYEVIDELNLDLEPSEQLKKDENSVIFGPESTLDSMGLVNLITLIEQRIEEKTGNFIAIADERAMSMQESPFKTVKTLKEYIEVLLNEYNA
jgi:acyl carrier protein